MAVPSSAPAAGARTAAAAMRKARRFARRRILKLSTVKLSSGCTTG